MMWSPIPSTIANDRPYIHVLEISTRKFFRLEIDYWSLLVAV